MKILYIIYSLSAGGAERFLTDLSNSLSERQDCDITILILKREDEQNIFYKKELNGNIHFKSLRIRKIGLSIFCKLYKAIKKEEADVVHIHLSPIILYSILPVLFYRKSAYIETLHNEVSRIDNSSKSKRILKSFIYRFGLVSVCAISDKNYVEFKKVFGRNCEALIYNGRKQLLPTLQIENVKQEIESYKINKDTIVVTHIARCAGQKNQDLLIDAFNQIIIKDRQNIILLVIGSGFDSDKGKSLQDRACKNIHFLGEKYNIQDYLSCSDSFCLSSGYEGMPITLIEALACKCIPLSTPVSGVVDLIEDNANGFISDNFSIASFVDMLNRYIQNREAIDRDKLEELYKMKLSMEACSAEYYKLYQALIAGK